MMIFLIIAALFYVVIAVICLARLAQFREAERWPQAVGTVTDSRLKDSWSKSGTEYSVEIYYEYPTATGVRHGRALFPETFYSHKAAVSALNSYPQGKRLVVRHNPQANEKSELFVDSETKAKFERTVKLSILFILGIGVALFFAEPPDASETVRQLVFFGSAGVVLLIAHYPLLKLLWYSRYQSRNSRRDIVSPATFRKSRNAVVVLPLILLCAGIIFVFGQFIHEMILASRSTAWPLTKGTVTSSEVTRSWDSKHHRYQYWPHVTYRIHVDNVAYNGNKIFFGFGSPTSSTKRESAESVAAKYALGMEIDVAYDSANPAHSVLEPGFHQSVTSVVMMVAAGSFFLLIFGGLTLSILLRRTGDVGAGQKKVL